MYWIYCLSFLFITSLLERGRFSKVAYQLSLFVLFIFVTGNYYNGIDWINYQRHYSLIYDGYFQADYLAYEPGFMFIMYVFGYVLKFENFHAVVVVCSIIAVVSFTKFIKKLPFSINRSLFIFIVIAFEFSLFNDTIRQLLAFSILLPLLPEIRTCSFKRIIFYCVVASLFHASAILMPFIFLILRRPVTRQLLVTIFMLAIAFVVLLLSLNTLVSSLGGILPQLLYSKLLSYLGKTSELRLGFFAIIDVLGLIVIYATIQRCQDDKKLSVYALGGYLFFLLHLTFYSAPFFQRLLFFIFPLAAVYAEGIFNKGNIFALNRVLLPITIVMSISVFTRNILNPYYAADFSEPKFFYGEVINGMSTDIEMMKLKKCYVISQYDPDFCPR